MSRESWRGIEPSLSLDRIKVGVQYYLSRHMLDSMAGSLNARVVEDIEINDIGHQFVAYVLGLGKEIEVVEWPATWWEHLKQRWFPQWALRLWPVKMAKREVVRYAKVCPHMSAGSDAHDHIRFFYDDVSP